MSRPRRHRRWYKRRVLRIGCVLIVLAACGEVKGGEQPDAADPTGDGPPLDAAIDADPCPDFVAPAASRLIHAQFCFDALGFNPNANPTTQTLACPGTGMLPGTYGIVLRPPTAVQADGCAATTPVTRLLAPQVNTALVQTGTSHGLSIAAGDHLRVRLACPDTGCNAEVQITARAAMGTPIVPVFPQSGFQIVNGPGVVDVDVALPASLVGATTRIVFIARAGGANANPDVLFENPHLVP